MIVFIDERIRQLLVLVEEEDLEITSRYAVDLLLHLQLQPENKRYPLPILKGHIFPLPTSPEPSKNLSRL